MTRQELIDKLHAGERYFHAGQCTKTIGPRGGEKLNQEIWRVNGRLKTWKTRPDDFRLPIKHGIKTCAYIEPHNIHLFHADSDCTPTIVYKERAS